MLILKLTMGDNHRLIFKPNMGGIQTAATLQNQAEQNEVHVDVACASLCAQTTLWAYATGYRRGQ